MKVLTSLVFSAEIPFRLALVIADLAAAMAPLEGGQFRESCFFPAEADWGFLDGPDILPKLVQLSGAGFRLEDGRGPAHRTFDSVFRVEIAAHPLRQCSGFGYSVKTSLVLGLYYQSYELAH